MKESQPEGRQLFKAPHPNPYTHYPGITGPLFSAVQEQINDQPIHARNNQELAEQFGVTPQAISAHMQQFQKDGHLISPTPKEINQIRRDTIDLLVKNGTPPKHLGVIFINDTYVEKLQIAQRKKEREKEKRAIKRKVIHLRSKGISPSTIRKTLGISRGDEGHISKEIIQENPQLRLRKKKRTQQEMATYLECVYSLVIQGKTYKEISTITGYSSGEITNAVTILRIKGQLPTTPPIENTIKTVTDLYQKGVIPNLIAEQTSYSVAYILKIIQYAPNITTHT